MRSATKVKNIKNLPENKTTISLVFLLGLAKIVFWLLFCVASTLGSKTDDL